MKIIWTSHNKTVLNQDGYCAGMAGIWLKNSIVGSKMLEKLTEDQLAAANQLHIYDEGLGSEKYLPTLGLQVDYYYQFDNPNMEEVSTYKLVAGASIKGAPKQAGIMKSRGWNTITSFVTHLRKQAKGIPRDHKNTDIPSGEDYFYMTGKWKGYKKGKVGKNEWIGLEIDKCADKEKFEPKHAMALCIKRDGPNTQVYFMDPNIGIVNWPVNDYPAAFDYQMRDMYWEWGRCVQFKLYHLVPHYYQPIHLKVPGGAGKK